MKPIVIIQPILFHLTGDLISLLEKHISKEFDALVKIASPLNDNELPLNLFDKNRRQWKSDRCYVTPEQNLLRTLERELRVGLHIKKHIGS